MTEVIVVLIMGIYQHKKVIWKLSWKDMKSRVIEQIDEKLISRG